MPGWHDATADLLAAGKIRTVGILQEQHPDRARLFMQWKEMGWPLLVDALNLLDVAVVPVTLLVDEHGIVRAISPPRSEMRAATERFLAADFAAPDGQEPIASAPPSLASLAADAQRAPRKTRDASAWRAHGEALALWGGTEQLDAAVDAFEHAVHLDPGDARARFRSGVVHRLRYDSERRRAGDFRHAVEGWTSALDLDPNQYIWRRRIQQYGPRLAKPYPFYDWVETARREVAARGEAPEPLVVEPGGAEIAQPAKRLETLATEAKNPDPDGRIRRDEGFVTVEPVVVPARLKAGRAGRIHLVFRPSKEREAHWNNEAEGLAVWIDAPAGWSLDRPFQQLENPPERVSDETRRIEIEIESPEGAKGTVRLPGYALYYVCEDVRGACLYRRQDLEIELPISR